MGKQNYKNLIAHVARSLWGNNFVKLNARNKIGMVEIKRNFRNKSGSQKVYPEVTLYPPPSTLPRFFPTFAKISDPQKTQGWCYFQNQGFRCSLGTRPPRDRNSCSFTFASRAGASHWHVTSLQLETPASRTGLNHFRACQWLMSDRGVPSGELEESLGTLESASKPLSMSSNFRTRNSHDLPRRLAC